MKTALICIARNENQYLDEFVKHHLDIGFSKVFICDNGFGDEESPHGAVSKHADKVEVLDWRNLPHPQNESYARCYELVKSDFKWVAFFDCDEFLVLKHDRSVGQFIGRFPGNAQLITVNWKTMTDNGLLRHDGRPLMERFTTEMEAGRRIRSSAPENHYVKCLVRGGLPKLEWSHPHCPDTRLEACHSSMKKVAQNGCHVPNYFFAELRHFPTKTVEEWCLHKMPRGKVHDGGKYPPEMFFGYNEKTPDKIRILKEFFPDAEV